jgi:hypothetical protein
VPRARAQSFKLQPADPFELIRWLARTQSDPRKATAELVQNSIDARATRVVIERRRVRGAPALVVRDDGEGVLPTMTRDEALRHLGTHIGHSYKLNLSPSERRARMIAGQYGIGLLGFWAIGRRMELRSRVAASELLALTLIEDRPTAVIERRPISIDALPTYTEIVIFELHDAASRALAGRRLADYLASELRGPLLAGRVAVEVHDHLSRGLAQKRFPVVPRRFEGIRLDLPAELAVDGHPPIRIELYLARGADRPAIQLSCAGTLVADDLADLPMLGFVEAPWRGRDVAGVIDFAGFAIPPGTRRGVAPDAAAVAFSHALAALRRPLEIELDRLERERRAAADRHVVDELRKALRGLREKLPLLDLPAVPGDGAEPATARGARLDAVADEASGAEATGEPEVQPALFPPGPLASVAIVPAHIELAPGGERRVHARALDADGRALLSALIFEWTLAHPQLAVQGSGPRPAVTASADARPGTEAVLRVTATDGVHHAAATASVIVVEARERTPEGGPGVPRPVLVDEPTATWRSRFDGDTWQVNAAHPDYAAAQGDPRARLRYLIALFGKEIVARTFAQPGASEMLEQLVAILTHAERNLRG